MITLTINQAMIKVAELQKIHNDRSLKMMNHSNFIKEYILELDGSRYDCNEVLDFDKELNEMIEIRNQIIDIKSKITKANTDNYIDFDKRKISLQEALNTIKITRGELDNLKFLYNNVESSKERKVDAAATAVYYKVKEPNFNKIDLQNYIDKSNNQILELEMALNKANNEITIEV